VYFVVLVTSIIHRPL